MTHRNDLEPAVRSRKGGSGDRPLSSTNKSNICNTIQRHFCDTLAVNQPHLFSWDPLSIALEQLAPVLFLQLNIELADSLLNAPPGLIALFIADPLNLIKARNRLPYMPGIHKRLFTLSREGKGAFW